jgi:hypothetical protein
MSYTKSGAPRHVQPTSTDPTSPFDWAGEMWAATGTVSFTAAYTDGSFAVHGSGRPAPSDFGEIGTVSNGDFVHP